MNPNPNPNPNHQDPDKGKKKDRRPGSASASLYWTGAHTTHRLRFHIVWIPKYRKRVLEGAVSARLLTLLQEACEVNGWQLHELNVQPDHVQPDHVHLLIQIPPSLSVSKVVNLLKGGTSRVLRLEFPDLAEFLWGTSFWGDGYFAESVGQTEEAVVRRYIRNQDKKHGQSQSQAD